MARLGRSFPIRPHLGNFKANIQSLTKTQSAIARIAINFSVTQPAVARIKPSSTYSLGASNSLPANNNDLATYYSNTQVTNANTLSNTTDINNSSNLTYRLHQFDQYISGSPASIGVTWKGKPGTATSAKTLYLQIYNIFSSAWETLATDTSTAAGTLLTMTATQSSNVSHYLDANNFVTVRVYQ
jgi:hypothetical protein